MQIRRISFLSIGSISLLLTGLMSIAAQGADNTTIERGRYLVKAADCAFCHTVPGGQPFAGGLAISTPFGNIYSSNITPDVETGIGKWSEQDFYNAMHSGMRRDGKNLYPAFPFLWFTRIAQDDVHAIKAYLNTVAPVRRENKAASLPWPLNMRLVMSVWKKLYFDEGTFIPNTTKSAQWNRGAYLVEGAGHCGACHTKTNMLGAPQNDKQLAGGEFGQRWYASGLTGNLRNGLGGWSANDIVEYLKTGSNARSAAAGPMSEVIMNSTRFLSDADIQAIATYLKDLGGQKEEPSYRFTEENNRSLSRGKALYFDNCTACHLAGGTGMVNTFPTLAKNSAIQSPLADSVVHIILTGGKIAVTPPKPTGLAMPAFAWKFNNAELADLTNYVRNAWGNRAPLIREEEVAKVRKDLDLH